MNRTVRGGRHTIQCWIVVRVHTLHGEPGVGIGEEESSDSENARRGEARGSREQREMPA